MGKKENQQKQQEIYNLTSQLSSSYSEFGDWKITKIYEARMNGESDPYNFSELTKERQAIRDKINALQEEIS